jgi:hypothetical protein
MDKRTAGRVRAHIPDIKREWEALLRNEPALTALAEPDTLVFMMDETLAMLLGALQEKSLAAWVRNSTPPMAPRHLNCRCGLNPLVTYFATAELAIRAALGAKLGARIDAVLHTLHVLAHREIDTLCSVCLKRGSDVCTLPEERRRAPAAPRPKP